MRLVYVTSGFPFPLTSGFLRHYHLLARLAVHHEIRLFSLVNSDHRPEDRAEIERLGVEVRTFATGGSALRTRAAQAARLAPDLVVGGVRALRAAVDECVRSGWPDAAIVSGKTTAPVLPVLAGLPIVADMCDATSMRLESRLDELRGARRWLGRAELRATRTVERRIERAADRVFVASQRDADHLGSTSMTVVPNGVDTEYWRRTSGERPRDTVVFTGKMSYEPNEDAALRLVDEVWPLVTRRRPDARLMIVGTSPRARLVEAGTRPGVEVTGRVDDMRAYLDRGTVFAAPIRFGAGIQNKVLEAMAMELPVVASTNAAEGLVIDGERPPIQLADDPATMAELLVAALVAADHDPAPVAGHRAWVRERFDWDASARRVDQLVHDAVADAAGTPGAGR
jgi:glycosyltransferase involved in cell wall biosynthesis